MDLRSGQVHLGLPHSWSGGAGCRRFLKVYIHGFHVFRHKPLRKTPFFDKSEVYVYVANTELT